MRDGEFCLEGLLGVGDAGVDCGKQRRIDLRRVPCPARPMPIVSNRFRMATSLGCGGSANCSRKFKYWIKSGPCAFARSQGGKSIGGAGGGAGMPRKALSGCSLYCAWIARTFATSSGPFSAVRVSVPTISVSAWNTFRIPGGFAPYHFGPAIR
jgi:hypothetical protein